MAVLITRQPFPQAHVVEVNSLDPASRGFWGRGQELSRRSFSHVVGQYIGWMAAMGLHMAYAQVGLSGRELPDHPHKLGYISIRRWEARALCRPHRPRRVAVDCNLASRALGEDPKQSLKHGQAF
eukprot:9492615-Pyramimonas_sp.AAC.1